MPYIKTTKSQLLTKIKLVQSLNCEMQESVFTDRVGAAAKANLDCAISTLLGPSFNKSYSTYTLDTRILNYPQMLPIRTIRSKIRCMCSCESTEEEFCRIRRFENVLLIKFPTSRLAYCEFNEVQSVHLLFQDLDGRYITFILFFILLRIDHTRVP